MAAGIYGHLNLTPVRSVARAILGRELTAGALYNCRLDLVYVVMCIVGVLQYVNQDVFAAVE